MLKKINLKVIWIIISLIIFECIMYLLAKITPFNPYLLISVFDNNLPYINYFVYFYIGWYLMLFFVPYFIYLNSKTCFKEYITNFIGCVFISSIVFLIFPTTIIRNTALGTSFNDFVVSLIYKIDTPILNCLPSMHCAISFLFIYYAIILKNTKWYYRLIIIILSILVITSTLLIKQHVIYDVFTALIMVFISVFITKYFKLQRYTNKYTKV